MIAIERDERAIAALEEIAAHYPGRLEIVAGDALRFDRTRRISAAARARDRRQPALQYRDRAAGRLAHRRAVAALVRRAGADVPARSRRAHRRRARQQDLWPAVGAGRLAHAKRRSCSTSQPSAFVPPPKVTSSVVRLVPRAEPLACDARALADG